MVHFVFVRLPMSGRKRWFTSAAEVVLFVTLTAWGCGIKTEVRVPVPTRIGAAKSATLQDLLAMLRARGESITSLSSTAVKVSLTSGKLDSGVIERYRGAPAYILLRRPDAIHLNILNPVTKMSLLELLSTGDEFEVWNKRDRKFYVGRNSAKEFELEQNGQSLDFTARPIHIFQAIFPAPVSLDRPDLRVALAEEQDSQAKYYVLNVLQDTGGAVLRMLRRLWIERSEMALVKEETYTETGQVSGIVSYSDLAQQDDVLLPHSIRIERPLDGYALDLQFGAWRVNPDLPAEAFVLNPPPGIERIVLKEKVRSGN